MSEEGRPSKFKPEYVRQAAKACELGATDKDLAELFDVVESTINAWKLEYPEFSESIKVSKLSADSKVEKSLFLRATGYEHEDTYFSNFQGCVSATPTIKRYPPSEVACIFWLKNRKPKEWRDKAEVELGASESLKELAKTFAREIAMPGVGQ